MNATSAMQPEKEPLQSQSSQRKAQTKRQLQEKTQQMQTLLGMCLYWDSHAKLKPNGKQVNTYADQFAGIEEQENSDIYGNKLEPETSQERLQRLDERITCFLLMISHL